MQHVSKTGATFRPCVSVHECVSPHIVSELLGGKGVGRGEGSGSRCRDLSVASVPVWTAICENKQVAAAS